MGSGRPPSPGPVGKDPAELEAHARELERRAVEADEAVVRALAASTDRSGSAPARASSSELRRLRGEADQLMGRALDARLEADRAAGPTGPATNGPTPPEPALPVTTWKQRELGWDQLLEAALDEPPTSAAGATDTKPTDPDLELRPAAGDDR